MRYVDDNDNEVYVLICPHIECQDRDNCTHAEAHHDTLWDSDYGWFCEEDCTYQACGHGVCCEVLDYGT